MMKETQTETKEKHKLCKAKTKDGNPCTKRAMLSGYCTTHFIQYGYKENREIAKAKKEKERLEKLAEKQNKRLLDIKEWD